MGNRNTGLTADTLFVAVTRPPMRWGVTYSALLFNLVFTMELFLVTKNLLTENKVSDTVCIAADVRPNQAFGFA